MAGAFLCGLVLCAAAVEASPRPTESVSPDWVWWEAETPRATNFPKNNPFQPRDQAGIQALSGGSWIGVGDPGKDRFLEYQVAVAKTAVYEFYTRKFWLHGPFRWRFDQQPWQACQRDVALLDTVELAKFVAANWVHLGVVNLTAGAHSLRIELLDDKGPAAFDCFLLTSVPFVARGTLRPGEKYGVAPEGWFPFEPELDPFGAAALDLRSLNEPRSGDGGFIRASGDHFIHGKTGQPVRFWAVTAGHAVLTYQRSEVDRLARFLAKHGVNMVRLHGPLWREDAQGQDLAKIDETKLNHIHYLTAALKKEGIYLALSTYFPLWLKPNGGSAFEGYHGDKPPFALPFFSQRFQQLQKGWWQAALTVTNPYTGLSLRQDPTLAFIEILNEDSLFFWTFVPYESVPAPQMQILERLFGGWLQKKDPSLGRTFRRWGGSRIRGDDEAGGRAGLLPPSDLVSRHDARTSDTVEFMADLQRKYYDDMHRYLKEEVSFKGSVAGSNWVTADARTLGPLDKWSNAGCDFMDRHGYFGGPHEGERAAYSISTGDRYDDAQALRFETTKAGERSYDLPIMDLAYNGKPSTISEISWVPPNRYRADMAVLSSAYGALQGSDALFFFNAGETTWSQQLEKFSINDPVAMGQFPATALLFRKGLVKTGDAVVHLEVDLPSLFAGRGLPISSPQNLDQLRSKDVRSGARPTNAQDGIDPLAFLVGRVEVNVTANGAPSRTADLSTMIDRRRNTVRSATGELLWDWGRGLATIDAPAAEGATGSLHEAGRIVLGDITISSQNEYGSVLLVAMDDKPLRTSHKMLLQVMSEDTNRGWSAPGKGLRPIASTGGPPIVVKRLGGRVTFKRGDIASLAVKALDFNGYETAAVNLTSQGELEFLPTVFYYLIEKRNP